MIHTDGTPTFANGGDSVNVVPLLNRLTELAEANANRLRAGYDRVTVKRDLETELRRALNEAHLVDAMEDIRDRLAEQKHRHNLVAAVDVCLQRAQAALLSYERPS